MLSLLFSRSRFQMNLSSSSGQEGSVSPSDQVGNQEQHRISIRILEPGDYARITALQLACFPGMKPWSKEQFQALIDRFPEGQMVVEINDNLVASSSSMILPFNEYGKEQSWASITGNGTLSTHDPSGDTLYGIEIMVHPEYRNFKLSRRLYDARKKLAKELNLRRIVIGGRLPNYHLYEKKMSVKEYVQQVIDKKLRDPVLTAQLSNGFQLKRIIRDYLPNDHESCGYATYLEWVNLDFEPGELKVQEFNYVRVCAVQYKMRMIRNFEEFAHDCEYFVDVASDYRCDFVVFPEMLTMQLLTFLPNKRPGAAVRMLSEFTDQYIELFRNLAIRYNINIVGGSHFIIEEEELYNVSFLFRRDGTIERQYKIHITPHERKWWGVKPGNKVEVMDTDCGKIAILICYDVEFPELARIAVHKGASILFVPFNTDERRAYLRVRYCAQARAIENQVYMVLAGSVGNLPEVDNLDIQYAQSAILTPSDVEFQRDGIAAIAEAGEETLVFQDLDMNLLKRHREFGSVQTIKDRRTDLYQIHFQENPSELHPEPKIIF
jgi:predicted amidohydrolase/ribosomal protein S18 acetylase RimI-like enzyme